MLWLPDAEPHELARLPKVRERMQRVKNFRAASQKAQTQEWANRPGEFVENRHPDGEYVVIPAHTSENRDYVPFGYLNPETIVNNSVFVVPDADLFTFGVISSAAHMAWLHAIGGRIKSDYRYSSDLVYNTFPWPDRAALTPKQVKAVEDAARQVLEAREKHPGSTLAQLYDPLTMPRVLRDAHNALDRAVDTLYGLKAGSTEAQRLALMLTKYQELAPTLESQATPKQVRKSRTTKS